jgi:hypothetical protein
MSKFQREYNKSSSAVNKVCPLLNFRNFGTKTKKNVFRDSVVSVSCDPAIKKDYHLSCFRTFLKSNCVDANMWHSVIPKFKYQILHIL